MIRASVAAAFAFVADVLVCLSCFGVLATPEGGVVVPVVVELVLGDGVAAGLLRMVLE